MKIIPKLSGFTETTNDYFLAARAGRILRMGIQLPTPPCNWRCPYCYVGVEPRQIGEADVEKIKGWIVAGKDLGATAVTINGTYEPTTNKHLFEVLSHARALNLNTLLVSNGSLLNEKAADILKELEISILLKMNVPFSEHNSPEHKIYSEVQAMLCGFPQNNTIYDSIMSKVRLFEEKGFNSIRADGTTKLGVESVITRSNIDYLPILARQLRNRNIYSHLEVTKVQGRCADTAEFKLTNSELQKMFNKILEDDKREGYPEWIPHPPYVCGTCYQNLIRLNIASNGDITPCPGVTIVVGNLQKTSMSDILNNPIMKKLRNLENTLEGKCKNCSLMKKKECYGGCRGTAFQELIKRNVPQEEAIIGSDPSCWISDE